MKTFNWQGINAEGKRNNGFILAQNKISAQQPLTNKGITSLRISACNYAINSKQIASLTRELATLTSAGLPLNKALLILASHYKTGGIKNLILTLHEQIENGASLSEALGLFPQFFDSIYCGLIIAGEQSGTLPACIHQLAQYLERMQLFKFKFLKALSYPLIVLFTSLLITLGLLIFVIPEFKKIYLDFGGKLPLLTQYVIKFSNSLSTQGHTILLSMSLIVLSGFLIKNIPTLSHIQDKLILKLPLIGKILNALFILRWCKLVSTTLSAGIPLRNCIKIAVKANRNSYYRSILNEIIRAIESGKSLHLALENSAIFPEYIVKIIAMGENTGTLPTLLGNLAETAQIKFDDTLDHFCQFLEPALMLFIALVVGGLIIAMYLPIFSIGTVL